MIEEEELEVRKQYDKDWQSIQAANLELESHVNRVCALLHREKGLRFRQIDGRPKDITSVLRKMTEKDASPAEMYQAVGDLVRARVVVYNLSDAEVLLEALLHDEGTMSQPSEERIANPNGYRAIHVNGRIGDYGCELQIRIAVQDAWAVTSRADVYRGEADDLVSILFEAQASILMGVDNVLQVIRDRVERSQEGIEEGISKEVTDEPVGPEPEKKQEVTLDNSKLALAEDDLQPEETLVLKGAISHNRVEAFKEGLEAERADSLIQKIFRAAGRYERVYEYDPNRRFGRHFYGWKGPLVEGSNWAAYSPQDFSRALEDYLNEQLASLVSQQIQPDVMIGSWSELSTFVDVAKEELGAESKRPDLIVKCGRAHPKVEEDILQNINWRDTPVIRGTPIAEASLRVIEGLPMLSVWMPQAEPSLHVVDLDDFEYRKTNPSTDSNDDINVEVGEVDFGEAVAALERNPDLTKSLFRNFTSEEGEFSIEEAIIRFQLQVKMSIVEGGRITAKHNAKWKSARMAPA